MNPSNDGGKGGGVLAFWADVPPEHEADFNEWYNRQHFPERLAVPGFLHGARYRALRGSPAYFAFYEVAGPAVLTSPAYLERLNDPTEWTQAVMRRLNNAIRAAFTVRHRLGAGRGGVAAVLRLAPAPGREKDFQAGFTGPLGGKLMERPGIVGFQALQAEDAASSVGTAERRLRGDADARVAWTVLVEGADETALETALAEHLGEENLAELGAAPGSETGIYRLLHARPA